MSQHKRKLRRIVLIVIIYLFAGVVTTIAVAWGIVLVVHDDLVTSDRSSGGWMLIDHKDGPRHASLSVYSEEGFGTERIYFHVWSWVSRSVNTDDVNKREGRFVPKVELPFEGCRGHVRRRLAERLDDQSAPLFTRLDARGWPSVSLWCEPLERQLQLDLTFDEVPSFGGIAIFDDGQENPVRTLPYIPIWRGFLFNTLFYAGLWFVLFFGTSRMRRMIRHRRGRCPMCGYQLHSDTPAGCSECGFGRGG